MTTDLKPAPPVPLADVVWRIDSRDAYDRQSSPTGKVTRYVPYLTAAIVADALDAWVGPLAWFDEYRVGEVNQHPVLWCDLTVHGVTKSDLGVPPKGDDADLSDKGLVSDAFKRAATLKWGVGRAVYRLPNLWLPCDLNKRTGKPVEPKGGVGQYAVPALVELGWNEDGSR